MTKIILTKEQVIKFIKSQRNNRPINFQVSVHEPENKACGCLLIHIFQSKFPKFKGRFRAGTCHVFADSEEFYISTPDIKLLPIHGGNVIWNTKTYGELKTHLDVLFR